MASVQYGSVVTQLKGSLGGTTYQSNRNGFSARNKPLPRNPKSRSQSLGRGVIARFSQQWRLLSQPDRDSWDVVAPDWPAVDKFGNPVTLSGFNVFIKANGWIYFCGGSQVDSGVSPEVLFSPTDFSGTLQVGTGTATIQWVGGDIPANNFMLLRSSRYMSQGRKYQDSGMRTTAILPPTTASGVSIAGELSGRLGRFPPVNSRVWFDVMVISAIAGNVSARIPFYVDVTI